MLCDRGFGGNLKKQRLEYSDKEICKFADGLDTFEFLLCMHFAIFVLNCSPKIAKINEHARLPVSSSRTSITKFYVCSKLSHI